MALSRTLGSPVKIASYLALVLGLTVYGYIERNSPRQPDPASGHVFRVIAPRHRKTERHVMYLTSAERLLYHGSFIVSLVGGVGILGQIVAARRRQSATPVA
jgi:hypothetical protein